MGRPEKPINPDAPAPIRRIAEGLRVQRHEAGLSYAQLASLTRCSASKLAAAASGEKLPSLATTTAFVSGCGGDSARWKLRWLVAHAELHDLTQPTAPPLDGDLRGFANRLRELLRWRGLSSLSEIAGAAGLSRATVFRALGGVLMPSGDAVVRLLNAADLSAVEQRPWLAARIRLLGLPGSVEEVFADHTTKPLPPGAQLDLRVLPEPERRIVEPDTTGAQRNGDAGPALRPPRGAQLDLQKLEIELSTLRKGSGVEGTYLESRVGPALRAVCGIPIGSPAHQLRSALVARLDQAVATLPAEQRLIASAALNLPSAAPEYKRRLYSDRVRSLAAAFDRDPRTMQRRVQGVLGRLAEALVQLDQDGGADG